MLTFEETCKYLSETAPPGKSVYGLGRINHLLDILGHPEKSLICVTIVGTNGKGSTIAFMDSILRAHGIGVACHIKPHLESVTERIRLNGIDSTEEQFADAFSEVKNAVDLAWTREDHPTYFELIFAAFLCAAKKSGATVALLEAGLGGRLDAVNAVDAPIVVLTKVDYDHTELLGNTLTEIANEKLAVVRPKVTLVTGEQAPEVVKAIDNYSSINNVKLIRMPDDFGKYFIRWPLALKGPYQRENSELAIASVDALLGLFPEISPGGPDQGKITEGLAAARLPGRWETIRIGGKGPVFILDGAHNPGALKLVTGEFKRLTGGSGTIIFGLKKTKDAKGIVKHLVDLAGRIIFTSVPDIECYDPCELKALADKYLPDGYTPLSQIRLDYVETISEAIAMAIAESDESDSILITGSLYLVGAARGELKLILKNE